MYSDEHREVFDGLVAQMGSAVRNARLQQERRRLESAEAAARAASAEREQAAQVLEALGDGVLFVDREDIVQFWNRAATLATGLAGTASSASRSLTSSRTGHARRDAFPSPRRAPPLAP